jgi:glycosyltransferase involved in cell wall biosynthesis
LRIALDSTPLAHAGRIGGLARYTSQLVATLAREFPEDEFILVSDQPFEMPATAPNLCRGNPPRNALERRWWTVGLSRELRRQSADVFHGVNFSVPFPSTIPAVLTIADLSPWATGAWVDDAWRARSARVRKRLPWLIRSGAARHIITLSEAVRAEIIRFFRLDPARVTAIPLAAAESFCPQPSGPQVRPYFLYAGMWEPRKNVDALIAAWSAIRASFDVDLVIAGPRREEIPLPPACPGLLLRGEVSEDELAALYSGAVALLYPSHYEGFGLPVLEAMQCGAPVIISRDPALVETAGGAGLITENICEAMRALLENPQLRAQMQARSLARAATFSWAQTARSTHQIYRSMLTT